MLLQLDGHAEEVTGIKIVSHAAEDYIVSTSQEGQLFSFLLFEVVFTCPRVFENFQTLISFLLGTELV